MLFRSIIGSLILVLASPAVAITVWHKERGVNRSLLEEELKQFSKLFNVPTQFDYVISENLKTGLLKAAMLRNKMPEVTLAPSDFIGVRAQLELSDVPPEAIEKDIPKAMIETVNNSGKIYGVPVFSGNHLMLFYNKSLVDKPAASFEEMVKQKKAITAKGAEVLAMKYGEMYWVAPFVLGRGGKLTQGNRVTLNTPQMVKALEEYRSLLKNGLTRKDCGYDCVTVDFYQGKFAYAINGEWDLATAHEKLGDKLGVALIPTMNGVRPRPYYSTNALLFPGRSLRGPKRDDILKLIKYVQSYDFQFKAAAVAKRFPVNQQVSKGLESISEPLLENSLKQLNYSVPMPNTEAQAIAWEVMGIAFKYFIENKLSAAEAAEFMEKTAKNEKTK